MRVALSLSKFYTNIDLTKRPIDELVERIGSQLGAVEEVISLREQYEGVLIVRVVSCEDHPHADRLRVCKIDDGGVAQNVQRDAAGHVQVVCGAPNVREGLLVAWLPPGVTVPNTFGHEPFVLGTRELRGVVSNGMLASAKELGISDEHEGILEVDEDVRPGMAFAEAYHLNDHIIDIENKMFTHRPDCFGVLGVYREIAGIYHQAFEGPAWYTGDKYSLEPESETLPLEVTNELPELVPRFLMIPMSGVQVRPSPVWLQVHLMRAGIRPINNVVDITNYLMYLTGQPLHAYDYDKVKALSGQDGVSITVRYPRPGEKIQLLNGKELEPRTEAIMIASTDHLIGVAGVMGGSSTEVDESTTSIILECATFDMYSIRRTSMAHGLFTDAVTRFSKGQSPLQNPHVIAKAVHEVGVLAGGKVAGELVDLNQLGDEVTQRGSVHPPVTVEREFINVRLGLHLTADEMALLLQNVEFTVTVDGERLTVRAPFWRTDIEIPEDIIEEVGRLYGYDHLPLLLPTRDLTPAVKNAELEARSHLRRVLARAGANEVLTDSFVHGNLFAKAGQDQVQAFQLSNALSPDLQYFRLSLTPSLLELVHPNSKAGYDQFALFEVNKVHSKTERDETGLPHEFVRVALVCAVESKIAEREYAGAAFYQARAYAVELLASFGLVGKVRFEPLSSVDFGDHELLRQMVAPYEPKRSAVVTLHDQVIGVVGEYQPQVAAAFKLPSFTAGFELFGSAFDQSAQASYVQLPRFPKVSQDISLKVPAELSYGELYQFVWDEIAKLQPPQTFPSLGPLDIYQRPDDTAHKQVTFRLTIASYERTLTAEEVNKLLDTVAANARERFGAERV